MAKTKKFVYVEDDEDDDNDENLPTVSSPSGVSDEDLPAVFEIRKMKVSGHFGVSATGRFLLLIFVGGL